jgi:chromosome segregation ATPase
MAKFTERLGSLFRGKRSQGDPVHPMEEGTPVTPDDLDQPEDTPDAPAKLSRSERDTAIAQIQAGQNQMLEHMVQLATKQAANTDRLDEMTKTVGDLPRVEKTISEHAHQLETLGRQVDASVGTTRRLHDEVASVHQAVDEVIRSHEAAAQTVKLLSQQMTDMESRMTTLLAQRKQTHKVVMVLCIIILGVTVASAALLLAEWLAG